MPTQNPSDLPQQADVLIVGAGIAGLYCAWRLLDQRKVDRVVIVERLNRTGGRLDTDLIKVRDANGVATVRDEEGGMRFNYGMKELMALNGKLGLCDQIVPFPMSPLPPRPNDNRYSLRGRTFTQVQSGNDNNVIWSELYNLADNDKERRKSPVDIITDAYNAIVAANGESPPAAPSPEYWQRFRLDFKWNGTPLNQWQLWGLLRDMGYTEECITMLSHAVGFEGPFLSLASAGEAFQILEDFPQDPTYFTFRDGYSTLANRVRGLVESLGGSIYLGVNVESIWAGDGGFDLALTVAPPGRSASPFVTDGVTRHIRAPKVILAIASHALAALYASSPVLHESAQAEQILADIQSVVNMRLSKINLYFDRAWWDDPAVVNPPVQYGPSFTDLPINAVYPFYSIAAPGAEAAPAALTIYCDFNNTNFWQGLQNVPPYFTSALQQEHSTPPRVLFPASVAVVTEALKQIKQLYGVESVPDPVLTSYRLWGSESDFGYAYHQWGLNADDRGVMERMTEPVNNLYTCNEALSDHQGWVNGSLRSADRVLSRFNIIPLVDDPSCQPCTAPTT